MLNHRKPKQTSWSYSDEKKGFVIESMEDIKRGEQVCDSYGRKCNSRFFLNYGFINKDNDANEVAVKVPFDTEDPTLSLKEKMLGEPMTSKTFRILANIEEDNTCEFMGFIRFVELRDKNNLLELMVTLHQESADYYRMYMKTLKSPTKLMVINLRRHLL